MQKNWLVHLRHLALAILLFWLLGLWLGQIAWTLVTGLGLYVAWTLFQISKLQRWLALPDYEQEPPESRGIWGDLFDGIYRLQSRHHRFQEQLQKLIDRGQQSTNALRDAVILTNNRGAMEWWNKAAEDLLGLRFPTDRGQLIQNLVRNPRFKRYFSSRDYSERLRIHSPHKPHIMLSVQITLFGEGDRLILAQDITRLNHLESMRRDFISNVSHELRTPLTVLGGYLETILDHAEDMPARWQRALHQMQQQAQRMQALVTDLLLLSKLEAHDETQRHQPLDLSPLLDRIIQDARALSGNQHLINLEKRTHSGFLGDEAQLHSAFSNIIFNAVKYTPAGGRIDIDWWDDDQGVHLSVRDTGMGFDPIHIPRLTERFYRADPSRTTQTGGTGLGLAIVKHVLINHEGELEIQSQQGKGSCFTCHFPHRRQVALGQLANG